MVNGLLASPVANSGRLQGVGRVTGNVVNNGTVAPGSSIGTLFVGGSFTQNPGGVYEVELSADGRSDLLRVSGPAFLNGGTLQVSVPRALYPDGQQWDLLTADGGLSGSFATVIGPPASQVVAFSQATTGNSAGLRVQRTSYGSFGSTVGDQDTGRGLDGVVPLAAGTGSAMEAFLIGMDFDDTAQQIAEKLAALSPEMVTTFAAAESAAAQGFARHMARRVRQVNEARALGVEPAAESDSQVVTADGRTVAMGSNNRDWVVWGRAHGAAWKASVSLCRNRGRDR